MYWSQHPREPESLPAAVVAWQSPAATCEAPLVPAAPLASLPGARGPRPKPPSSGHLQSSSSQYTSAAQMGAHVQPRTALPASAARLIPGQA